MNQKTFLEEYKNCADEATLNKIWQFKATNDIFVDLRACNLYDLTPLKACAAMERLFVNDTFIQNLKPLIGLPLKELYIGNTQITDISPLAKIPTLKRMGLGNTQIRDISPLKNLKNLHSLSLDNMPIEDLGPLKKISLSVLDINNTPVEKLNPLNAIGYLNASHTNITDLGVLKYKKALRYLDISATKVSDISALSDGLLGFLNASSTLVIDVSPLKDLPLLRMVALQDTVVSDISPLSKLLQRKITRINLVDNGTNGGEDLYLKGCPITNPPFPILEQGKTAVLAYWGLKEEEHYF
jgi:internalin A